jgi:acyl dehydratase
VGGAGAAGDTLRVRATVVEARVSRSKPDRGVVRTEIVVLNQDEVAVLTMTAVNIMLRRSVLS